MPVFGDVPAVALLARGVLGGDDPEPRAQLSWVAEPSEVADFGDQPERGAGRDPLEPRQDLHGRRPPLAARDRLEVAVERVELAIEPVEMEQHLGQRCVREIVVKALADDPLAVGLGPLRLAVTEDPPVAEQLLADPMPRRGPSAPQVIAAAHQVPEPFGLRRRRRNERELPAAVKAHELLRVTPIGLDPVAGADRDQ